MFLPLILMTVISAVDSSVLPILRIVDLTNPWGPHFTVQTTTQSTTPFVPPAFKNLRNSVNLDLDAAQATLRPNWGKNPLFARDSFAPVFSELRGNRLEE